jgi:hypothetical protein
MQRPLPETAEPSPPPANHHQTHGIGRFQMRVKLNRIITLPSSALRSALEARLARVDVVFEIRKLLPLWFSQSRPGRGA